MDAERQGEGRLRVELVNPASGLSGLARSYGGRRRFPSPDGPRRRFRTPKSGNDGVGSAAGAPRGEKGADEKKYVYNHCFVVTFRFMYFVETKRRAYRRHNLQHPTSIVTYTCKQ